MITAESPASGNPSTFELHTLLSGKIGQPFTIRTLAKVLGFCWLAFPQEKRPIPSFRQTFRRSGLPEPPNSVVIAPRCDWSQTAGPAWAINGAHTTNANTTGLTVMQKHYYRFA